VNLEEISEREQIGIERSLEETKIAT